jgi:hypothetical protein
LTEADDRICAEAMAFARKQKGAIPTRLTDRSIYPSEKNPVAVFMAGSPGAGKTEASKELLATLEAKEPRSRILRIDPDDLRGEFSSYAGNNSHLFQGAISILVARILDLAHDQRQSFLLDGTFSNLAIARENVVRCLKKKRAVQILYVYQDPLQAWRFVQARELEDGRNVPVERFIEEHFCSAGRR